MLLSSFSNEILINKFKLLFAEDDPKLLCALSAKASHFEVQDHSLLHTHKTERNEGSHY